MIANLLSPYHTVVTKMLDSSISGTINDKFVHNFKGN